MTGLRFTLTPDRIVVHDGLYERPPSPAEAEAIREALETKGFPWWVDYGTVALGIAALIVLRLIA